jgi:hypothetical protein
MKIKLSRRQWEFIGRQAQWHLPDNHVKTLYKIFTELPGALNKTDRISTYSKEIHFNDIPGDAYISISYNGEKDAMHVEKYYDNEMVQNEMGEVKLIPIDWNNPKITMSTILNIINVWIGINKTKATEIK